MGHRFDVDDDLELPCSPDEVWAAIATGPGIDSWFLGRNAVDPGIGGTVRSDFAGGAIPGSAITAWEPGRRLVTTSDTGPDGRFLAHEHLIAARGEGSSVLRIVTSGFLPGDDWDAEFAAMRAGECAFRATLVEYLTHFSGQKATPLTRFGPVISDWPAAWTTLDDALGLIRRERGEKARLELPGGPVIDGVLFAGNDQSRSIRADGAIYRFIQGLFGPMVLSHIIYTDADHDAELHENAWQTWVNELYT